MLLWLTLIELNTKCSYDNQQESAAFLWQGHFSAERQASPEILWRRRAGWSAAATLFPSFYRAAQSGFSQSPCFFPSGQSWSMFWNFHTHSGDTLECAQHSFYRQRRERENDYEQRDSTTYFYRACPGKPNSKLCCLSGMSIIAPCWLW